MQMSHRKDILGDGNGNYLKISNNSPKHMPNITEIKEFIISLQR